MGVIRDRHPIDFRQVCAIARVVLLREPSLSDSEWKAGTRETIAKQGYDEPESDLLIRALNAVENALKVTMGARPVPQPGPAPLPRKAESPELTPQEWKAFAATLRAVIARSAAVPSNVVPMPRERLDISEPAALDQFYAEAHSGDRLAALRRFAEIAIVRPPEWDYQQVREHAGNHLLSADACYACRMAARQLHWHHIIQVQHGGSNYARNRVAICAVCHAAIHPWMPSLARQTSGWSSFADAAPAVAAMIGQAQTDRLDRA